VAEVRVELGLDGGQVVRARVVAADADQLESLVAAGRRELVSAACDEGRLVVDTGRVVYLRRFGEERPVGYSR
jgi:hypothetical protein